MLKGFKFMYKIKNLNTATKENIFTFIWLFDKRTNLYSNQVIFSRIHHILDPSMSFLTTTTRGEKVRCVLDPGFPPDINSAENIWIRGVIQEALHLLLHGQTCGWKLRSNVVLLRPQSYRLHPREGGILLETQLQLLPGERHTKNYIFQTKHNYNSTTKAIRIE